MLCWPVVSAAAIPCRPHTQHRLGLVLGAFCLSVSGWVYVCMYGSCLLSLAMLMHGIRQAFPWMRGRPGVVAGRGSNTSDQHRSGGFGSTQQHFHNLLPVISTTAHMNRLNVAWLLLPQALLTLIRTRTLLVLLTAATISSHTHARHSRHAVCATQRQTALRRAHAGCLWSADAAAATVAPVDAKARPGNLDARPQTRASQDAIPPSSHHTKPSSHHTQVETA